MTGVKVTDLLRKRLSVYAEKSEILFMNTIMG